MDDVEDWTMHRKHQLPSLGDRLLRLVLLIVLTPLALGSASCGGDDGSSAPAGNSLIAIEIAPANPSIPRGEGLQFKATGVYGDSRTADLSASVSWASSTPAVAEIARPDGFVVGVSEGTTAISATFVGAVLVSGSTTLTVTPPAPARLLSISVTPNPAYSGVGMALQMKATGTYSDRTTADLTARVSWTSGTPSVATIGSMRGMTTGIALGSSTITASIGSEAATTPLSIVSGVWVPSGGAASGGGGDFPRAAVLLPNGKVLFPAWGYLPPPDSWLYEAIGDEWLKTSALTTPRSYYSATLLPTGKVLVVGGRSSQGIEASAELYDPTSGTWSVTGRMSSGRMYHTATLLLDGKVLVVGGGVPSAELYDPMSGTWTVTGSLTVNTSRHTATLLPNGKVLVAGGDAGYPLLEVERAELYDPVSKTWTLTGSLGKRMMHTATLLPDGKVLVAGGAFRPSTSQTVSLSAAETYDPASGTWSQTAALITDRRGHTATLMPNGKVLVAGGVGSPLKDQLQSTELYDPATGTWSATASLRSKRSWHAATLLPNGKVLVRDGSPVDVTAELYW